ncbi:hypothetical protein GCM10010220_11060 [Streptomyces parvulus]|nr:hypothetical protein GCM10010220_11060 [Streptomyces parvulus]
MTFRLASWTRFFACVAGRFSRVVLRWRMRDHMRGLLAPVERKNGWQLAEFAGHRRPAGFGIPDGVLIVDDTGFLKKGTASAGGQRRYSGTAGHTENCQIEVRQRRTNVASPSTKSAATQRLVSAHRPVHARPRVPGLCRSPNH